MWWQLAYLIPGLALATLIWEVAVNGWSPKSMDAHSRHMLSLLPMAIEASSAVRVRIVLYLVGVIVAWPMVFLLGARNDPGGSPPRKKTVGEHRRR